MRLHLNTGNERLENLVSDNIDLSREVINLRHRSGCVWGGGGWGVQNENREFLFKN